MRLQVPITFHFVACANLEGGKASAILARDDVNFGTTNPNL